MWTHCIFKVSKYDWRWIILKERSFETSNLIIGKIFVLSLVFITIIPVPTILLSNTLAFCILMEIVTEFKDLMKYDVADFL